MQQIQLSDLNEIYLKQKANETKDFNPKTKEIPLDKFESSNKKTDKSNNGKFDISECAVNFIKGVLSPIDAIAKHPVISIATIGVTAAICTLIPVLAPIMTAGFGILSAYQLGNGIYSAVKNYKNGEFDKAEQSFNQIGQGSVGIVTTVLGAKQSAKIAKEAKLMDELKTSSLSLEQKAKISAQVDSSSKLDALKEIVTLFTTKAGRKAVFSQFKPSNIMLRGKDVINSIQALRGFKYTQEGKRRAAMSTEEIEQEIKALCEEVFDEYEIPEELRPKIYVVNEDITHGGGYDSNFHVIKVNEKGYREGMFDLPNVIKHEATHAKKALEYASLSPEAKDEILQEYLLNKIANGDNNTVMYDSSFLGATTMTPPKLNAQMKNDFSNFVKTEIYGKNTWHSEEEFAKMVRPFVESNKEFCSNYKNTDEAVNAMAKYALSHQLRYNVNSNNTANFNPELLKNYKIDPQKAKATYLEKLDCHDANGSNNTVGQTLGLGGGDYNQYQFCDEEVLAQQKGNEFEISKLTSKLDELRAHPNYDKNEEAFLLNQIEISKGTVKYKTIGREYYKLHKLLENDPQNKELAKKCSDIANEMRYLKSKINPKINKGKIIYPNILNATTQMPENTAAAINALGNKADKKEENNDN